MKVVDVARATDLHRNTITLLYDETATRIDIETINRLCKLFGCSVGEPLEYREDGPEAGHGEQRSKRP